MSVSPARSRRRPPAGRVTLRPAEAGDCRRIWLWRNDEETRRASLGAAPIPFDTHERWFARSLRSRARKIYVVLADGRASGVARLDLDEGQGTVSLHLAAEWRGRGVGPAAIEALAELAFGPLGLRSLRASVKRENSRSISAFRKAGFTLASEGEVLCLEKIRR